MSSERKTTSPHAVLAFPPKSNSTATDSSIAITQGEHYSSHGRVRNLAGRYRGNLEKRLGIWMSDDGKSFGWWRAADRPLLKIAQRLSSPVNEQLLSGIRRDGIEMCISEDLSTLQWSFCDVHKELPLDGSEHVWQPALFPLGVAKFQCTSRSSSKITFEVKLPLGFPQVIGDIKLLSDSDVCHVCMELPKMSFTLEFKRFSGAAMMNEAMPSSVDSCASNGAGSVYRDVSHRVGAGACAKAGQTRVLLFTALLMPFCACFGCMLVSALKELHLL
eukprot:TRINITY_DN27659_c0_g1_i1.p1 TRINITY_DN27659_c0_g1~~TRINITY_DN27659_c0_g1_i1.p1  ORF type:complete len:275 (+),score=41.91 TRINITY_DN27659_c0_g1_i1:54-878(+)